MNFLARFYPGDDAVRLAVGVALQIAGIVVLATATALILARRNAALRDGILRAALALVCVAPLLAWGFNRAGISFWQTAADAGSEAAAGNVAAVAGLPTEPRAVASAPSEGPRSPRERPSVGATAGSGDPRRSARLSAPAATATPSMSLSPKRESLDNRTRFEAVIGGITLIWAIGALALVARLIAGLIVVARLRRGLKPLVELPVGVGERLITTLGVASLPPIMLSKRIGGPASVGLWRPVVVLPEELALKMSADALHDTLAHECAHTLRRDALVALVQQIVAAVYWVHPLVHVLNRQLARAREEICDNVVLAGTTATDYARTLLALSQAVQSSRGRLAVIPMFDRRWRLARRVAGILNKRRITMTRMNKSAVALVAVIAITAGLALAAISAAADPPNESQTKAATTNDSDSKKTKPTTASNKSEAKTTSTVTEPKTVSIPTATGANSGASGGLPEVPVSRVIEREVTDFEDFTGNIVAPESVKIIPRVTGYLVSTSFKEGSEVKKGDKLFEIDPRPFQAELDRAEAELNVAQTRLKLAQAEFERFKELLKRSAISQEDYKKAEATLQEAQATMAAAKANVEVRKLTLSFCTIMSPIDGRAGGYNVTPGNLVKQDETVLTTIVSHDSIGVSFDIDERTWLRMAKTAHGAITKAFVRADDEHHFEHEGVVSFFGNEFNRSTGTIPARATIANPQLKSGAKLFIPGMHVTIRMIIAPPHKALLVPNDAVFGTAEGLTVWIVDNDGHVESRLVSSGHLHDDGLRVITSGLKPNEEVVIKPVGPFTKKIRPNLVPMPTLPSAGSQAEK